MARGDKGLKPNSAATISELNRNAINTNLDNTPAVVTHPVLRGPSLGLSAPLPWGPKHTSVALFVPFPEVLSVQSALSSLLWWLLCVDQTLKSPSLCFFLQHLCKVVLVGCPVFVEMPVFSSRLWVSRGQEFINFQSPGLSMWLACRACSLTVQMNRETLTRCWKDSNLAIMSFNVWGQRFRKLFPYLKPFVQAWDISILKCSLIQEKLQLLNLSIYFHIASNIYFFSNNLP